MLRTVSGTEGPYLTSSYVAFQDSTEPVDGSDKDIDVYLIRGSWDGNQYVWTDRIRINQDAADVEHDQFWATLAIDDSGVVHAIWYDTRFDPQDHEADDVKLALMYAEITDLGDDQNGEPLIFIDEYVADQNALNTEHLIDPNFIGDYLGLTTFADDVIGVYTATRQLPVEQQGFQGQGMGGLEPTIDNAIASVLIAD